LPASEAKSFAELLDDVPLSNVVHLGKMVSDRLCFLRWFEAVVHLDPYEERVRERTQLQKFLVANTWLFGEEYALGTDDENIAALLEKHVRILERDGLQQELSEPELQEMLAHYRRERKNTPESLARIPDIMLWRRFVERRADEYEFLVIEIKRPGVVIGRKEMNQIEDYAKAIVTTPMADTHRTNWVFILVSDSLDAHAQDRTTQQGLPRYTIQKTAGSNYEIRVVPWSDLIRSYCRILWMGALKEAAYLGLIGLFRIPFLPGVRPHVRE
jgi:hypothetical protein